MSDFIQSLEPRTLLSATVTKDTLLADKVALAAQAKTAKADAAAIIVTLAHDTKSVQTDLKGSPASDATLLKTLRTDEAKTKSSVQKDLNSLLGPTLGAANRTIGQAIASISHSSAAAQAKIAADLASLATITAAPLAKLSADLQAAAVVTDLQAITSANTSNATLATDIAKLESDMSTDTGALNTAAAGFQTGVSTVSTDVAAAPSAPTGSTVPNIIGTFSGTATDTAGNHPGRVQNLQIVVSTESDSGALTGTSMVQSSSGTNTQNATGTINASGDISLTLTDPTDPSNGATISGHFSGGKITGTFTSTNDSGTFTATRQ